jgi:transcriptional regulator with XRE-family HTH domain
MSNIEHTFSKNLSLLRGRLGISLHKLADELGISENTLRNIEYGNSMPKVNHLIEIADYFGVDDLRGLIMDKIK